MKLVLGYELPFILSILVVIVKSGSIKISDIINFQLANGVDIEFCFGYNCLHCRDNLHAGQAGTVPFDMAEAEQEIIAGALVEYSGPPLGIFKLTKWMMLFAVPSFIVVIFMPSANFILNILKYALVLVVIILIKNTNPRLRIDQAVKFFWIPCTILSFAAVILALNGTMNKIDILTKSINVFHAACSPCNNCDIEILDALTPRHDLERFGITLVGSIRHADAILVTGVPNMKTAKKIKNLYENMPAPKLVIAIGTCACGGHMFRLI